MVISIDEILKRNLIKRRDYAKGEGLVEPEGVAVDIRLDEVWEKDVTCSPLSACRLLR